LRALTIPIAGADFLNKRGPTRRFGIALCKPGDPIELRPEPKNPVDPMAIAIFQSSGIQLGYVPAEKVQLFRSIMGRGVQLIAIFQQATERGGLVRIGFDEVPDLPTIRGPEGASERDRFVDEWPVDPIWDED